MKKVLFALMGLLLASSTAFAGFGVQEDGTYEGEAGQVNASTDLDVSVASGVATFTLEAAIAPSTSVSSPLIIATQYTQLPYYSKLTRPASGATAGSMLVLGTANSTNCGTQLDGTTYNVCVSDGTNWIDV